MSTCLHFHLPSDISVYHTLKLENLKPLWTGDRHSSSTSSLKEKQYKCKILFIVIKIVSFDVGDWAHINAHMKSTDFQLPWEKDMSHPWQKYFNFLVTLISRADLMCHQKRIQGRMEYYPPSGPLYC